MIQVNQVQIPEDKVFSEMQYHPASSQREAMMQAAESLIIGELLRQRARTLGLSVAEDSVEASDRDFIEELLDKEVAMPAATEAECEQYFAANPERFVSSPLLAVRHILVPALPEDDEERVVAKDQAQGIIERLQAGEDFVALARATSSCPSRETGGSLGQISRGQTVPEFERQVFSAEPGLMPRPVESRYGFHVVYIDEKVPGNPLPYEAVRDKIADYLNDKVYRKAVAQYIQTLIADAKIDGYDFNVSGSPLMQ